MHDNAHPFFKKTNTEKNDPWGTHMILHAHKQESSFFERDVESTANFCRALFMFLASVQNLGQEQSSIP